MLVDLTGYGTTLQSNQAAYPLISWWFVGFFSVFIELLIFVSSFFD